MSVQPEPILTASALRAHGDPGLGRWDLDALSGRFIELAGGPATAALTLSAGLIRQVQDRGRLAAWIGGCGSIFYPPDLAAWGIDLAAFPCIRTAQVAQLARAADTLTRSGGFALLLLDLGSKTRLSLPIQSRLVGLAQKHHTALVALTHSDRDDAPGQPLVSLRGHTEKKRSPHGGFICHFDAVKDKRTPPGWHHSEISHGPEGLF